MIAARRGRPRRSWHDLPSLRPPQTAPRDAAPPPVVVYAPESLLRHPGALVREMARDLGASRELAWRLFVRNVSARYRQTVFGYVWAFLPPLVTTALFVLLRRGGLFSVADTGVPYVAFVLTGMVLWQTFAEALLAPLRMVGQSRSLLTKINFPREALLLAALAEVTFSFCVRALLLVGALAWFRLVPPPTVALVPVGLAVLVAVGLAIGTALVPLAILYQDVEQALGAAVPLWMFATPVLYPAPVNFPGTLTMTLNPVGPALDTTRAWLLGGSPHLAAFGWVALGAFAVLLAGWLLYRLALPILIERMSA